MARRGENIYKRKDGRWEARILQPNGKYRYLYAKTYKSIKERKNLYQESREVNADRANLPKDVSSLFDSWLKNDVHLQVKPTTYEYYYHCIYNYVIPFFNKAETFTVFTVHAFVDSLRRNNSISESYKKKILTVFKVALRKILRDSPECPVILQAIKLPTVRSEEVNVFSRTEQRLIETTVMHCHDHRALGIIISFYTGIRLGELCALTWEDIDFESSAMSIVKTVSRTKNFEIGDNKTTLLVGIPKSGKSVRKIPLPDFIMQILNVRRVREGGGHYFLSGSKTPIDPRTYQKFYKKILFQAGVKDRKFHAIRHTFATRALELGVDIKTLSEMLGHSNVSITLNIYAHSIMEQKKIAIDKFNEMHITCMSS